MKPSDFHLLFQESVPSTQDYAKQRIRKKELTHSGAVWAKVQTEGRGRNGNGWVSDNDKGLWVTLYLETPGMGLFDAVIRTSLSVRDALSTHGLVAAIKWPNDLIVGQKKICGILAETVDNHLLIGLGVNLRQEQEDFPLSIRSKSTSLFIEQKQSPDSRMFLDELLERFCLREDPEVNFKNYSGSLGIVGQEMEIGGALIRVQGVDRDGALVGRAQDGQPRKFYSGSLRWRDA